MAAEKLYFEGDRIIACTEYAAAYFSVTAATLSNWMAAGCPRHKHGFWDIRAVTEFRQQREGEKLAEAAKLDPEKLTPQQYKVHIEGQLKQAQLEAANLRNEISRGDYLSRDSVVSDLSAFFLVLKRSVTALGRELVQQVEPQLDPLEARKLYALAGERVDEALEQMSVAGVYHAPDAE